MTRQLTDIQLAKLDPALANRWADTCLAALQVDYPYSPGHFMVDANDTLKPAKSGHPAFHGALDWHSACHLTWSLTQLSPALETTRARKVASFLSHRLSPMNLAAEAAYFKSHPDFERPYGWAWYLKLTADAGPAYEAILMPLAEQIEARAHEWLTSFAYPIRHGAHTNSAFAISLMFDAATRLGHTEFAAAIERRAVDWFANDHDYCTEFEPSGSDFLSPALSEAVLMGQVMGDAFSDWLAIFLPQLTNPDCALRSAPVLGDDSDGQLAHLYGLCLTRSWQLSWLGRRIGDDTLIEDASRQAARVADAVTDGNFMSTHWLVSYALLAETA